MIMRGIYPACVDTLEYMKSNARQAYVSISPGVVQDSSTGGPLSG